MSYTIHDYDEHWDMMETCPICGARGDCLCCEDKEAYDDEYEHLHSLEKDLVWNK